MIYGRYLLTFGKVNNLTWLYYEYWKRVNKVNNTFSVNHMPSSSSNNLSKAKSHYLLFLMEVNDCHIS